MKLKYIFNKNHNLFKNINNSKRNYIHAVAYY